MMTERKIRIGAHQLSWGTILPPKDLVPRLSKAKELGCKAFEVFITNRFGSPSCLKEVAEKTGLTLIGCGVIMEGDGDPLSTDEGTRRTAEATINQYIQWTYEMGSSLLVGPMANVLARPSTRPPTDQELEAGVKTFRNVAKFASSGGVRVAIEPIQWSEMPWPNTVQQVLDFINKVEAAEGVPKNVLGVLADIYHMNREEEDYLKALEVVLDAEKLYHMHVAGPNRTPPRPEQHIRWRQIVSLLKEVTTPKAVDLGKGWEGTITIESFGKECDLPYEVIGPGERLPAEEVISTGVATLRKTGLWS